MNIFNILLTYLFILSSRVGGYLHFSLLKSHFMFWTYRGSSKCGMDELWGGGGGVSGREG